jgi:8-oxo-dGTP pyrophosphatase MutT (NUDIX family)
VTGSAGRLASRRAWAGRLLTVDVDRIRSPNGTELDIEMIRHPGAAAVVPLVTSADAADPAVLLIRQYRYAADGMLWEIPAGVLEPGEDPLDCARRELREETGAEADQIEHLTTIFTTPGLHRRGDPPFSGHGHPGRNRVTQPRRAHRGRGPPALAGPWDDPGRRDSGRQDHRGAPVRGRLPTRFVVRSSGKGDTRRRVARLSWLDSGLPKPTPLKRLGSFGRLSGRSRPQGMPVAFSRAGRRVSGACQRPMEGGMGLPGSLR